MQVALTEILEIGRLVQSEICGTLRWRTSSVSSDAFRSSKDPARVVILFRMSI
jgi:hypothetical protein